MREILGSITSRCSGKWARTPAAVRENEPALIPRKSLSSGRIKDRTRETAEIEPREIPASCKRIGTLYTPFITPPTPPPLPPPTTTPNRAEHTITTPHRLYPKEGQLSHSQEWKNLPNLLHQSNQLGQETECPPEKHCSRFNVLRIIFQTKCGFPDFGKRKTINCFLHED